MGGFRAPGTKVRERAIVLGTVALFTLNPQEGGKVVLSPGGCGAWSRGCAGAGEDPRQSDRDGCPGRLSYLPEALSKRESCWR